MKTALKYVAIAVVALLAVSAVGYEVYSSRLPSSGNECAGVQTSVTAARPAGHDTRVSIAATNSTRGAAVSSTAREVVSPRVPPRTIASSSPIQVVAAENFWGSLASQMGGNLTSVLSIVSDPNSDPHEYESNVSDAVAISNAQFVIVNGVGYDDWALQLIAADNHPGQVVLNVGSLNGVAIGGGIVSGNPHMWYNPGYVNATVAAMYSDLVRIDPSGLAQFQQNYAAMNVTLASLYGEATNIKNHFSGTIVAATEDIFVYLANFTNLDLVSPPEFMQAVAEGNDPPAQTVVTFQCQLESGHVKVLVYNQQTVTPITINLKAIAAQHNVTVVGVTETIQPPGVPFQVWMNAEYLQLYNALNANQLGK